MLKTSLMLGASLIIAKSQEMEHISDRDHDVMKSMMIKASINNQAARQGYQQGFQAGIARAAQAKPQRADDRNRYARQGMQNGQKSDDRNWYVEQGMMQNGQKSERHLDESLQNLGFYVI